MNLRRIGILFTKEVIQGPKSYLFIMVLGLPIILSLVLTLIFGTFFSGKSRLGLVDQGSSAFQDLARQTPALDVRFYNTEMELRDAVARGAVDIGLSLPAAFDEHVRSSEMVQIGIYVWGESQMQHRIIISSALLHLVREIAGHESPVEIVQTVLGEGANIPWEQRLLPLIVLMTILMGGTMIPSTSLVTEKMKRTLSALAVSPATLPEIFVAKGLLGVLLSIVSAMLMLFLNQAFGSQPLLLLFVLLLGSAFSASVGVLLGALIKDINTLFTTIKGMGLLLYGPGLIYMFPELPQWLGRFFPTYYVIHPVVEISQRNAGLTEIAPELAILIGLIGLMFILLALITRRTQEAQAAT